MELSFFIARKISRNQSASFSKFIIKLATVSTVISVAVMIIAVAVVQGFKHTIEHKMLSFWGNVQVAPLSADMASVIGNEPVAFDSTLMRSLQKQPNVTQVFPYLLKPVIFNTGAIMEGVKLKGVNEYYSFNSNNDIQFSGGKINFKDSGYSKSIILSESTLERMNKKVGDEVLAFFFNQGQTSPPIRKLKIIGAYHTGMTDIDKNFGICDIRLLQRVGNLNATAISAYQISLKDYHDADKLATSLNENLLKQPLSASTMGDIYPDIFNWLRLLDTNAVILLVIMSIIAAINMATALLIFILERTPMIGVLKSLGMSSNKIQMIFWSHAALIATKGILFGTLTAIILCLIQQYFHVIKLDETNYLMKYAPAEINIGAILLIDVGSLIFCTLVMYLPSLLSRRINIIKALKF